MEKLAEPLLASDDMKESSDQPRTIVVASKNGGDGDGGSVVGGGASKISQVVPFTPHSAAKVDEKQRLLPPSRGPEPSSSVFCCCCAPAPTLRPISSFALTAVQKERLEVLRRTASVPFDSTNEQHRSALTVLGRKLFGSEWKADAADGSGARSASWAKVGFQGVDPATDLRGSIGLLSLQNLTYFVDKYGDAFQRVCDRKTDAEHYLPAAICGVNVTSMLVTNLCIAQSFKYELNDHQQRVYRAFIALIGEDEAAFAEVYSSVLLALFAYWQRHNARYMEFGPIMEIIRAKFTRAMAARPDSIADFQQFMRAEHT